MAHLTTESEKRCPRCKLGCDNGNGCCGICEHFSDEQLDRVRPDITLLDLYDLANGRSPGLRSRAPCPD